MTGHTIRAVVVVEQFVGLALEVADSVTILNRGKVVLTGSAAEVAAAPELLEQAYLGSAEVDLANGSASRA